MEFCGSLVVVVFFMYLQTYLQYYSTVLLYMCSKQEHKADHGHKKGHAPRAQEGRSFTGISRPRTEVLRTRANVSAANTLLRSRASRGHLNLFFWNEICWICPRVHSTFDVFSRTASCHRLRSPSPLSDTCTLKYLVEGKV